MRSVGGQPWAHQGSSGSDGLGQVLLSKPHILLPQRDIVSMCLARNCSPKTSVHNWSMHTHTNGSLERKFQEKYNTVPPTVSAPPHWPWATHSLQVTPLHPGIGVIQVGIRESARGGRQGWGPALPLTEYELGKPCHLKSQLAHPSITQKLAE